MGSDPLRDAGFSQYSPYYAPTFDSSPYDQMDSVITGLAQEAKKKKDFQEAMANPNLRSYLQRLMAAPGAPGEPGSTPLYPGVKTGAEALAPDVGLPMPYPMPGKQGTDRVGAQQIVNDEVQRRFGGPAGGVQMAIGEPTFLSRNGQPSDPMLPPAQPQFETTIRAKREYHPSTPGRPMMSGPVSQPREQAPLFDTPEQFAMFAQLLPQATQRDITKMQTDASVYNEKNRQKGQDDRTTVNGALKMLDLLNRRQMNTDSIEGRVRAVLAKGGKTKQADLLKLAKEAGDQAAEMDRLVNDGTMAALDTLPKDSQAYQQYQMYKQQAAQKRALSESLFQQAQIQYGVGASGKKNAGTPVKPPPKAIDQMSLDDVNAELARLGQSG